MSARGKPRRALAGSPRGWDAITLLPGALPGFAPADIDTSARFLGRKCALPLLLEYGSSGGDIDALCAAARSSGVPANLGALAALDSVALPARATNAPRVPLLAELRLSELSTGTIDEALVERVRRLELDAIILRLDLAEVAIAAKPVAFDAGIERIAELARQLPAPLVPRDQAGLPRATARALAEQGIDAVITGGVEVFGASLLPGTSDQRQALFQRWGIPAVAAIRMLRGAGVTVVSDGAIASGLDAARAIALGADLVVLTVDSANASPQRTLDQTADALRTTMYLTGARSIPALHAIPFVATGDVREWLEAAETLWRSDPGGRV